jgi:hypothetical protein
MDIDRARELQDAEAIDKLCDGDDIIPNWEPLTVALHELVKQTCFDGFCRLSYGMSDLRPELQTNEAYFNEMFNADTGFTDITEVDHPEHSKIWRSVIVNGVKVFCLVDCTFITTRVE